MLSKVQSLQIQNDFQLLVEFHLAAQRVLAAGVLVPGGPDAKAVRLRARHRRLLVLLLSNKKRLPALPLSPKHLRGLTRLPHRPLKTALPLHARLHHLGRQDILRQSLAVRYGHDRILFCPQSRLEIWKSSTGFPYPPFFASNISELRLRYL
jgi:hypothetical protein